MLYCLNLTAFPQSLLLLSLYYHRSVSFLRRRLLRAELRDTFESTNPKGNYPLAAARRRARALPVCYRTGNQHLTEASAGPPETLGNPKNRRRRCTFYAGLGPPQVILACSPQSRPTQGNVYNFYKKRGRIF